MRAAQLLRCAAACAACAGAGGVEYTIAAGGQQLQANDEGDGRLGTKYQSHDAYARFIFEAVGDAYRIRVAADGRMLHADDENSFSVETKYQGDDDYNHFHLSDAKSGQAVSPEKAGTHGVTFRTVASSRAWTVGSDGFVSTVSGNGSAFALAATKFTPPPPPPACGTKRDCNYNGACRGGACVCEPAFTGERCNVMNLLPTTRSPSSGLRTVDNAGEQVSSWGGSVLRHDDGKYHMWAAEMVNGVGIKSWISNSRVVHAVADAPSGPYVRKEAVWPVFAHEPTVSRAPTGEYVMYFTGGGPARGQKYIPCTGKSCSGHNGTSALSCPNDQQCTVSEPLSSWMSYAASPDGPWSDPALVPAPGGGDTNLAAVIYRNGSMFGLGRPGHYWASPDWRDVKQYKIEKTRGDLRGEDPMVWVDAEEDEKVLHAVLHGGGWSDPFGFHYFSDDGGRTWVGDNSVRTYDNAVSFSDAAGTLLLSRRERPHVILDKPHGTPVALSNGVTEAWPCALVSPPMPDGSTCAPPCEPGKKFPGSNGTGIWCPVDYCYTLVQPLGTA